MVDRIYFTVIFLLIFGASGYFIYERIQALRENVQILKGNQNTLYGEIISNLKQTNYAA